MEFTYLTGEFKIQNSFVLILPTYKFDWDSQFKLFKNSIIELGHKNVASIP